MSSGIALNLDGSNNLSSGKEWINNMQFANGIVLSSLIFGIAWKKKKRAPRLQYLLYFCPFPVGSVKEL